MMRDFVKFSVNFWNICVLLVLLFYLLEIIGAESALAFIFGMSLGFALINAVSYIVDKEWHWKIYKLINWPLVRYYENREQNYKDVIVKLESQLYGKDEDTLQKQNENIYPTGSVWYLENSLNREMEEKQNNAQPYHRNG